MRKLYWYIAAPRLPLSSPKLMLETPSAMAACNSAMRVVSGHRLYTPTLGT